MAMMTAQIFEVMCDNFQVFEMYSNRNFAQGVFITAFCQKDNVFVPS
jgi:hypothetical protein